MRKPLAVAAALVALVSACAADGAAPPPASGDAAASPRVPGEYIVTLAPGADRAAIESAFGALGVSRVRELGGDMYLLTVGEDPGPARMEALRAGDARIRAVQPNFVYRGSPR